MKICGRVPARLDDERLARLSKRDASPTAIEELDIVQLLLELLHLTSQRRLRHVESIRGTTKMQFFRHDEKGAEEASFYHA